MNVWNKTIFRRMLVVMCITVMSCLWVECGAEVPEVPKKGLKYWGSDPYAALPLARKQRKMILVEFYADWNHRSRWMSERVLGDSMICSLVESNFITVQVATGTPRGAGLAEAYQVTGYPAILIFNSNGDVLDKIDVTLDVEDFEHRIKTVLMAMQGMGTWRLNSIYEAAERGDSEGTDAAVAMFLRGQLPQDVANIVVWPMFENSVVNRYGSAAFDYLVTHVDMFRKENGKQQVDVVLTDGLQEAMLPYVLGSVPYVATQTQDIIGVAKELGLPVVMSLESMADVARLRCAQDLSLFLARMVLLMDMVPELYDLPLVLSLDVVADRGTRDQKKAALDVVNVVRKSVESQSNMVLLEFLSERLK